MVTVQIRSVVRAWLAHADVPNCLGEWLQAFAGGLNQVKTAA